MPKNFYSGTVSQRNGQLIVTVDNQWEAAAYYFDTEPSANLSAFARFLVRLGLFGVKRAMLFEV